MATLDAPTRALAVLVGVSACVLCPAQMRIAVILGSSYGLYALWPGGNPAVLALSTLVTYAAAVGSRGRAARWWLGLGIAGNLVLLGGFKELGWTLPGYAPVVPLGLSFFTLQAMGYLADVARGEREAERDVGRFAAYLAFFPHVISGPIARSTHLLPQLATAPTSDYERMARGLRQVAWGLFLKLAVANNLARFVDAVYGNLHLYRGFPLLFATFFFAIQLYADFAGYSQIAVGTARILGYELGPNFDRPYLATNLADFWRRWHISLSRWLADNIHRPLSLALRSWPRAGLLAAALLTFTLCGLWHGARSTYVVWGALHGLGLGAWALSRRLRQAMFRVLPAPLAPFVSVAATFAFVCVGWVFFRAPDLDGALHVLRYIGALDLDHLIGVPIVSRGTFVMDLLLAFGVLSADLFASRVDAALARLPLAVANYLCLVALGLGTYVLGVFEEQTFIYAQF